MNSGRIVLSQLIDFLPMHEFGKCVRRYQGDFRVRTFSCFDQFLTMMFAQLSGCDSLRHIEIGSAMGPKLYHAGLRGQVSKSTLADANDRRDWRIFGDFAQVLIRRARALYVHDGFGVQLKQTVYAFDSTTIALCLALFPWARFRRHGGAIKLHTLIDLSGSIPCFIWLTAGTTHDINSLDQLHLEAGAFYVMDRGYLDFGRLFRFTQGLAFFITRAKSNLDFRCRSYRRVDKSTGLRSDQTIVLNGFRVSRAYPMPLRRITFYDAETKKHFVFLTNHFELPALVIAQLYKCRWKVELFFKWIKQHLHVKGFYGTSENAVKTQIWIAISVYVLVAILKKDLGLDSELAEILEILRIALFEKVPLAQVLTTIEPKTDESGSPNQLRLFNL